LKTKQSIHEWLELHFPHEQSEEPNFMLADNFEEAFLGVSETFGQNPRACYDYDKCIEIIMADMDDNSDIEDKYVDAIEFFEFNVLGSYAGEYTPAFVKTADTKFFE
tara:strand:+ start:275 stop:595 length:321 start_codon:yes stop_codon:yes gene_type:complete